MDDIKVKKEILNGFQVDTVYISSDKAVKQIIKQSNTCSTIRLEAPVHELRGVSDIGDCLAQVLKRMLEPYFRHNLCICGLGNKHVKSDALGPETVNKLPIKFLDIIDQAKSNFSNIYAITVDVEWHTNISLPVFMASAVSATKSDCILIVDSIVAENYNQLYREIQISEINIMTTHIGGRKVDWSILGVPVVSVGVPMVIPASSLFPGAASSAELLTSIHVDTAMAAAGTIIAYALMRIGWPLLSKEACFGYTKLEKDPFPYMEMEL